MVVLPLVSVQSLTRGVKVSVEPFAVPATVGAVATIIVVGLTTKLTVVLAMVAPPAVDKTTASPARILENPLGKLVVMVVLTASVQPDTIKNVGVMLP